MVIYMVWEAISAQVQPCGSTQVLIFRQTDACDIVASHHGYSYFNSSSGTSGQLLHYMARILPLSCPWLQFA